MTQDIRRTIAATPSLKDVAAAAGVSFQTASKVLNNKGTVSALTRERIFDAANALGYVPNALARSLASARTRTIGVITSDFSDATLAQPLVGVEREARQRGLCAIIGSIAEAGSDFEANLRVLLERRVDGIIINTPVLEHDPSLGDLLMRTNAPVVALHGGAGDGASVVTADDYQLALTAIQHLASLGHRRIAMITGPRRRHVAELRAAAYCAALEELGLPRDDSLVAEGNWDAESGYQATHLLLDRANGFTALYAHNDMMAVGVLAALHERGVRVPAECSVVACDDLPISGRTIPPLTTIRIPFSEIGEEALRQLVALIEGGPPQQVMIEGSLVFRGSTAAAPA